jgi:hypothetical protein
LKIAATALLFVDIENFAAIFNVDPVSSVIDTFHAMLWMFRHDAVYSTSKVINLIKNNEKGPIDEAKKKIGGVKKSWIAFFKITIASVCRKVRAKLYRTGTTMCKELAVITFP